MEECNYCRMQTSKFENFEDMFSLKGWANRGYCSSKCISEDIENHKSLIDFYGNDVNCINHELYHHRCGIKYLSEKEENKLKIELDESMHRRTILMQKLPLIKLLMKYGKLRYKDI